MIRTDQEVHDSVSVEVACRRLGNPEGIARIGSVDDDVLHALLQIDRIRRPGEN